MFKIESYCAVALVVLAISNPTFAQENLLKDDKALLRAAMPSNWEFRRVLDPCTDLKVRRSVTKGQKLFRIQGSCGIKNALAPDEDCYGYSLDANGTIDTPTNATIRKVTLRLLCSG